MQAKFRNAPKLYGWACPIRYYSSRPISGVTGSCHELRASEQEAILIDCGLFQGQEAEFETVSNQHGQHGNPRISENIPFAISHIKALIVTHVHIDYVGRLPHSPLLKAPASPWHCDTLVMESTYGDKNHPNRKTAANS